MKTKKVVARTMDDLSVEDFISAALFSASELAHVSGADRKLVNVWLSGSCLNPLERSISQSQAADVFGY